MFNTKAFIQKLPTAFSRLKSSKYCDPVLTPENWCVKQPCQKIRIASKDIILTQPTSTLFVYLLGILTIGVGIYFFWIYDSHYSRLWWGISLILWGIGALLAGTSYQAFGYEIKCANRDSCAWTSWWEVIYLMFQQVSMGAMLIAVSYSCTTGSLRLGLLIYAILTSILYVIVTFIGGIVPFTSVITFNVMVRASIPILVFVFFLNSWRYYTLKTSMDLALLVTWLTLLLTSAVYYIYDELDITEKLWNRGKWFSQNDVLHIGLIFWIIYIATVLAHQVKDYSAPLISG